MRDKNLVNPLEERPAALGRDVVALEGVSVAVGRLHVGEDVSGRLREEKSIAE